MASSDCTARIANSTDSYTVGMNTIRGIICTIGVLGNLAVIFVILVLREYRKAVTHWYVLQLAIADVCFLLTLPFAMLEAGEKVWKFSDGACKFKDAILFINYYSSVLFLIVMSFDRYIAVCCPFSTQLQRLRKKKAAYIITCGIWVISIASSAPIIAFSGKKDCACRHDFPSNNDHIICKSEGIPLHECADYLSKFNGNYDDYNYDYSGEGSYDYSDYTTTASHHNGSSSNETNASDIYEMGCHYGILANGFKAYIFFNFIAMFLIPSVCLITCYTLISLRLKATRQQSAHDKRNDRNRVRVTILCSLLVALFIICWLPYHAQHLAKMNGIHGSADYCRKVASVTTVFIYLNSALNPYVYNFIGRRFTNRLRRAAGSVKTTLRKSTHSFSSDKMVVRYKSSRNGRNSEKHNSATASTRLNSKRSSEEIETRMPSKVQYELTNLVTEEGSDKKVEE